MRYATAYSDSDEISTINKKAFNETTFYKNLEELIKEHNINTLIMSVAGPKIDNAITKKNKNLSFNQNNLKEKFKLKECYLLNDWESIAHSYCYIKESIQIIQNGKKYNKDGTIIPQEKDALTCEKAKCARVFKSARDMAVEDPIYEKMRRYWRANET